MECCWERSNGGAKNYMKKRWRIRKNNACRRESEKMLEEDIKVRPRGEVREGRGIK